MKTSVTIAALLLALSTIGSSCVNEGATVSVNLKPIVGRYRLGTSTTFSGLITVRLDSLVSAEYKQKIRQGRVYDLRVHVEGDYAGAVSAVAAVRVRDGEVKQIIRFPAQGTVAWASFQTPQSLLSKSPYLAPQPEGISELLAALTTSPLPDISIMTLGTLTLAPVPDNLYVVIEVYLQADAEIN
ncbi:MAG: hypothetical protein C4326_04025 [Ignavibacteria bacterium]